MQRNDSAVAGYVEKPPRRWVLYLALVIYGLWLAFLGLMIWVRMTDPHYTGP